MSIQQQAAQDAQSTLRVWSNREPPVDPIAIARMLGLEVMVANLPSEVSGALIKELEKNPVVFLNRADSLNRQRFTCAHEIGHYVYRMNNNSISYEFIDFRGTLASAGIDPEEIYANSFAAELLMPEDHVRNLVADRVPRAVMAAMMQVSDDALRFRMMNLGLK